MTLNIQVHLLQIMVLCANASLRWTELNEQKSTSRKSWCILTKSRCAVQLPHPSLQDVQLRKTIEEMENIVSQSCPQNANCTDKIHRKFRNVTKYKTKPVKPQNNVSIKNLNFCRFHNLQI